MLCILKSHLCPGKTEIMHRPRGLQMSDRNLGRITHTISSNLEDAIASVRMARYNLNQPATGYKRQFLHEKLERYLDRSQIFKLYE